MDQILLIIGASIFGLLGTAHLIYTFFTDKFSSLDPSVADAMKGTSPKLTRQTTMWRAWIGFNASHSLGAMFFAAIYIPLTLHHFDVVRGSLWFSLLPVVLSVCYLALAKLYWFKIPFVGIFTALICFALSAFLINT